MSAELEVLQDATGRLEGAAIPYMLTGSVALSYYAEPRMTRDIDLVVELAGSDVRIGGTNSSDGRESDYQGSMRG